MRRPGHRFVAVFVAAVLAVISGVVAVEALRFAGDALERPGIEALAVVPSRPGAGPSPLSRAWCQP